MKRFYGDVAVCEAQGGWQVTLDGRGLKTVAGQDQVVPSRALADIMAREWADQGEELDVARFRMRDTADYAISQVAAKPSETVTKLLSYGETDTLCYRADPEDALYKKQLEVWEPIVTRLEEREGITLVRASGIMHKAQNEDALAKLRTRLDGFDPFTLAGLELLASLAASLTVALEVREPGSDPEVLWRAASLEEEWQAGLWGRDSQAEERRAKRRSDFLSAAEWLTLLAND